MWPPHTLYGVTWFNAVNLFLIFIHISSYYYSKWPYLHITNITVLDKYLFVTLPGRLWENQLALYFEFHKFKLWTFFCGKSSFHVPTNYMLKGSFKSISSKNLSIKKNVCQQTKDRIFFGLYLRHRNTICGFSKLKNIIFIHVYTFHVSSV